MSENRYRRYQITENSENGNALQVIASLETVCEYLAWCRETAPTTGHVHLHIYMRLRNPCEISVIKRLFPTGHIEVVRGSEASNIIYLKKQGDFHEVGEPHLERGDNMKIMWKEIIEHCEGNDIEWIKDNYPSIYVTRLRDLERIRNKKVVRAPIAELCNEWIWGDTGTGKSRSCRQKFPDLYQKSWNKWWDNYEYEDTVLMEDADPDLCEHLAYYIKIWGDHHPFNAEVKGGMFKAIRPGRILITSNYTIDQCFPREEDRAAIKRRFREIHYCSLVK